MALIVRMIIRKTITLGLSQDFPILFGIYPILLIILLVTKYILRSLPLVELPMQTIL